MILRLFSYLAIAAPLALLGCHSRSGARPPTLVTPVPFQASSLESRYAVRGFFAGTVTREPGRLVIVIKEARLRSIIPVQNVRVRAGLGRRGGQTWKYDPQGPQVRVRDNLAGGQEVRLDTLTLTIPVNDQLILEAHWVAFQIAARRETEEFTTYVCTPRDIFRPEGSTEVPPSGDAYAFWC